MPVIDVDGEKKKVAWYVRASYAIVLKHLQQQEADANDTVGRVFEDIDLQSANIVIVFSSKFENLVGH
jgi:hypothetical protein